MRLNILNTVYDRLANDESVTIEKLKNDLPENDFNDVRLYIKIFSKTFFRAFNGELTDEQRHKIMLLRREFFTVDNDDYDEYQELIKYFEDIEDYESCHKLKQNKQFKNKKLCKH